MNLKYSILYVDDEQQNLRVFKSAFRRKYQITIVESGKEALQILEEQPFDMILTDQRMPKMTGLDLLREIRNVHPHMMRIILTGYSDINVIAKALNECRLYRYFTKPWSETEMNIALENAFKSYQLEKDNRSLIEELTDINESLEEKIKEKTKDIIEKNVSLEQITSEQEINLKVLHKQHLKNQEQAQELKKANENIKLKNDELERAFFIIHEKNHRITSSIRYAQKIQQTILPTTQKMERVLQNYFVMYRAKDIVSGDFYWLHELDSGGYLVAVIDCTGHGVPGAFMSLIGHTFLNEIVKNIETPTPNLILEELHNRILDFLQHPDTDKTDRADDGMDVVMCAVYPNESKAIYSGAKRPLYVVHSDGELTEYSPTRFSIGTTQKPSKGFENQEFEIKPNDTFCLFSDGFIDQPDKERRRFTSNRLKLELSELASDDSKTQGQKIGKVFDNFRMSAEYRDDITLMGIKF